VGQGPANPLFSAAFAPNGTSFHACKEEELPIDGEHQWDQENGENHLHLKPGAEEMNVFVNEHEKNRSCRQKVFHREKDEGAAGKIVSHDGIDLCRAPLDQLQCQERIKDAQQPPAWAHASDPCRRALHETLLSEPTPFSVYLPQANQRAKSVTDQRLRPAPPMIFQATSVPQPEREWRTGEKSGILKRFRIDIPICSFGDNENGLGKRIEFFTNSL
jgi:hypothetical protein